MKKLPTIKELQTEYAQLLTDKKTTYAEYRQARAAMRELLTVKNNVDRVLAMEQTEPQEKKKTTASGELVAVKSVRHTLRRERFGGQPPKAALRPEMNAQPQIENLCSKGAWGTSLNKQFVAVWIATSIACHFYQKFLITSSIPNKKYGLCTCKTTDIRISYNLYCCINQKGGGV